MGDIAFDAKKLQADLITLGYLPKGGDDGKWGGGSKRALKRFKRRAKTTYRIHLDTGAPADCAAADCFKGDVNEEVNQATLDEVKKWLDRKWKAPLGRFKFTKAGDATLREDVSTEWQAVVTRVKGAGGTLDGPYGDSKRSLGKVTKVGASSYSFHIVGRAVDINQAFGGPPNQRYYIAKDFISTGNFWRIYCKTDAQDGTQGVKYDKNKLECWSFWGKKSYFAPAGYYMDMTAEIESGGKFERIKAHTGWESNTNKSEWWHFQWVSDKQETFEDECELVGISTQDLKNAGYTSEADRDHAPG